VTRELKAIREEAFSRAFDSLYERCKLCAGAGGDYNFMASVREPSCHTVYSRRKKNIRKNSELIVYNTKLIFNYYVSCGLDLSNSGYGKKNVGSCEYRNELSCSTMAMALLTY
jgi:hypothetical protein